MQLGKALLGAIAGAAVGMVLLLVVYLTLGFDKAWLAIPFAFITGLGVRLFATTPGHASYIRGALTMVLALAGYIGGLSLVEQVASARANTPADNIPPAAAIEENPAAESSDAAAQEAEVKDENKDQANEENKDENKDEAKAETKVAEVTPKVARAKKPKPAARESEIAISHVAFPGKMTYTPVDVICLAVAALVAYELGRGSGIAARPA